MGLYTIDDDYNVDRSEDIYIHDEGNDPEDDITFTEVCNFFGRLLENISKRELTADLLDYDTDAPNRSAEAYIVAQIHFMGIQDMHKRFHAVNALLSDLVEKEKQGKLIVLD